jgi:hypothetical protein
MSTGSASEVSPHISYIASKQREGTSNDLRICRANVESPEMRPVLKTRFICTAIFVHDYIIRPITAKYKVKMSADPIYRASIKLLEAKTNLVSDGIRALNEEVSLANGYLGGSTGIIMVPCNNQQGGE